MNWKPQAISAFVPTAALAAISLAACGGSGGGSPATPRTVTPTAAAQPTTQPASSTTTTVVTIKWPVPGTSQSAASRRVQYVSQGTASVNIVAGGTTTEVDNPNLTSATGAPTEATSAVTIPLAPSTAPVTFTVTAYDKTGAKGNELGSGSTSSAIVKGQLNSINITLNGNLGSIGCAGVAPLTTATGTTGTAFKQVGVAGQLMVVPKDPDGFTIIMPGTIPALTLAASDTANATATATSTTDEYDITVTPSGTAENFNASGTDLNSNPVTATCSVTRDVALYVTNIGQYNGTASITIYDATVANTTGGTVAAAPIATIADPSPSTTADVTDVIQPQWPAVDPKGDLFVTNQGPLPTATYGPDAGYVAIYGPGAGQSGNAAPIALIPNLNRPEGIDFDSAGNLYVMSADRITEYPPTADGVTAPAVASNTITGSNTDLFDCYGMHVDTSGNINAACSDALYVFPKGSTGNVTPEVIEPTTSLNVAGQLMTYGSYSWLDAAADSSGNIYGPGSNNNVNMLFSYMAGASGNTSVPTLYIDTAFSEPTGIYITPANAFYLTNRGSDAVMYFASTTTLTLGLADTTISGTGTGLSSPFGVTAR